MKVYYKNHVETAVLSSPQSDLSMPLNNIYHYYLSLPAGFTADAVTISGEWPSQVSVSALCIGLTNALNYTLTLFDMNGGQIYSSGQKSFGFNKIEILDLPGMTAGKFVLELSGNEPITLGLVYLGGALELPLFSPGSSYTHEFTGKSDRSMGGYAYGLRKTRLRSFSAVFPRVDNLNREIIDEYMDEALNVQAHIIDPYPEAREEFPPFYGTLVKGFDGTKRDESGFYWKFNLEWMEAK
jgi:hypothetical protein